MVVQLAVDGGGVDRHVGVGFLQRGNALGRSQQADELDRTRGQLFQPVNGGGGRIAGGQHGVDDDDVAFLHLGGHLEVVLHRLQRGRVTVQADVAHARPRHHVEHAVQKAVARPQDGHEHQFLAIDDFAGHGLQRGFDLDVLQRHVACDLVGHQGAQLAQQAAKAVGAGVFLAHQGQLVLHQRVVDEVDVAHGGITV